MVNDIQEIKNTLDSLIIETALNTAHLKTLTIAFHQLSEHVLQTEESKNLKDHYYNTLYEKSSEILNQPALLYNQAKAQKALFELHSFVQNELKDLNADF
jgi:acyl-[acyl carrier protein]--UDP-N-acetylglucosamine O-acyltransferase